MKKATILLALMLAPMTEGLASMRTNMSSTDEARTIDATALVEREGIHYVAGENTPYTGVVVGEYHDGQIRFESHYRDGVKDGSETTWYTNGNIHREQSYKDGEPHGAWISWDRDANLLFYRTYNEGEQVF